MSEMNVPIKSAWINYKSMRALYKEFAMKGVYPGHLKSARGICIDPETERIYVVERGNSRIHVFSPEGVHLFMFHPERSHSDLWGICIRDGFVVVSDYHHGRLFVFSLEGEVISEFGKGFDRRGNIIELVQPMGVKIGQEGEIYICEFGASKLLIVAHQLNLHNVYQLQIMEKPHDVLLTKNECNPILLTGSSIIYENRIFNIFSCFSWFGFHDLVNDNLIINENNHHRIMIYELKRGSPELVHTINMLALGAPMGLAVDKLGRIVCVTSSKMYFFK